MGNEEVKPLAKKKNHSFDIGAFHNIDKILPINHASSSMDIRNASYALNANPHQSRIKPSTSLHQMPSITNPSSYVKPRLSIKEQNAKLEKLTKTNDQLRKQLMEINKKLSEQLQKKKMPTLMPTHGQKSKDKDKSADQSNSNSKSKPSSSADKYKIVALKKQLQNAYSQVSMYKKQIQILKKNDSHQNDIKLQTTEDKVTSIESQIINVQKSLESMRSAVSKQKNQINGYEEEMAGEDVQENKREISMLKERLKKIKEMSRKKEKDEKMRHELLIQMERKVREANSDYVPEIRNWAAEEPTSKSRIAQTNRPTKIIPKKSPEHNESTFRYLPSKLEIQQVQTQLKQQKQTHEEYHKKIDIQIKRRNVYREERQRIQIQLETIYKTLENLQYKKERYIQLIMGNISVGGEGMEDLLSIGDEDIVKDDDLVVKGENIEGQVEFSDAKAIPHCDKLAHRLKIVTLNVWTSDKGHITALQFYYTDGDSFYVGKKSAEPTTVTEKHSLQLAEGDYIRNVMGIFNSKNKFLEFVVFESVKGKVLKVGKESFKNNNFNLRIGKGQRPAMIGGACVNDGGVWRINRLDFLIKSG